MLKLLNGAAIACPLHDLINMPTAVGVNPKDALLYALVNVVPSVE